MSSKRIDQLTALTTPANADPIAVYDSSAASLKQTTFTQFHQAGKDLRLDFTETNYQTDKGYILSSFYRRPASDYSVSGAGSSISVDTTYKKTGDQTLKVTCDRGSAAGTTIDTVHAINEIAPNAQVGVWIYIPDYTLFTSIIMHISMNGTNFSEGYYTTYSFAGEDKQYNGWHFVCPHAASWSGTYGTPDNDNHGIQKLRLVFNQNSASTCYAYIDAAYYEWAATGKMIIFADDGYASFNTSAVPILDTYGYLATFGIVGSLIDSSATWLTSANLATLYAAGHDLAVHGATSLDLLADNAARRADVKTNRDFLNDLGYTRATKHYVWPSGTFQLSAGDPTLKTILHELGFTDARGVTAGKFLCGSKGWHEGFWQYPILGVDASTSTATLDAYMSFVASSGRIGALMYHDIVASGASGNTERNLSDFTADMAALDVYVQAGTIDVVTVSQAMKGIDE